MSKSLISIRRRFDRAGIALAGLCALHCIATVIVVSSLGLGGHFLLEPAIHRVGLALALIIAAIAIGWSPIQHRRPGPFVIALIGLVSMGAALGVPHGVGETVLTIFGVSLVSVGHLLNLRAPTKQS
ncbi:MerC domain-containing protein [Erythrobacter sp. GH1-10]|uniref:MerC domain-containing protein n=1 Tax=Erythrobacter sp. GH1-10 TaxID=3349334 RepID=UPI003877ADD2